MEDLIDEIQADYIHFCDKEYVFHLDNNMKINLRCKIENLPHLIGIHKLGNDCNFIRQMVDKNDYSITTKNIFYIFKENGIGYNEIRSYEGWTPHLQRRMEHFTYEKINAILRKTTMFSFIFDKEKTKNDKAKYVLIDKRGPLFLQLYIGYDDKKKYYYPNSYVPNNKKDSNLARDTLKVIRTEIFSLSENKREMIEVIEHAKIRELNTMIKEYNSQNNKLYRAIRENKNSLELLNTINSMAKDIVKKYKKEIKYIDNDLSSKLEVFLKSIPSINGT